MTRGVPQGVIDAMRREAADVPEMSPDEIHAEIAAARERRKAERTRETGSGDRSQTLGTEEPFVT